MQTDGSDLTSPITNTQFTYHEMDYVYIWIKTEIHHVT